MPSLLFHPEPAKHEKKVRALAKKFADEKLRPSALDDDEACVFRRDVYEEAVKLGLSCQLVPKMFGGKGENHRCHYAALEELAKTSVAMSIVVGVTNLIQGAILHFGTPTQQADYLPGIVSGKVLPAFSLSEPGSGSDAASLTCAAKKVPGGYRLTGNKCWCSSGGVADLYLVMARTGEHKYQGVSAFLVKKDSEGFRVGKQEKKLGLRASTLAELIFEDCFVSEANRLGQEGEGFKVALSQLDSGRIAIASAGSGVATEALERAWMEGDHGEGVKQKLAEYFARLQACKLLISTAADNKDDKLPVTALAAQAKLLATDLAMELTTFAIDAFGVRGYTKELQMERLMRDAKALQIVEGTNQIQRLVIARQMEEMLK